MGVLIKPEIVRRILNDDLIKDPNKDTNGNVVVEGASYDLCAGTVIWKDSETKNSITLHYDPALPQSRQAQTTLHPGQMMFVVTKEEIKMPLDLSATVYSRNQLARDGILALNTGHVDPGYEGPIIIRLINLRAISYTLTLGNPIYTIVFQKLEQPIDVSLKHPPVSRAASIEKARKSVDEALANALYDLALLNSFVKKDDFGKLLWDFFKSNFFKTLSYIIAIILFVAAVVSAIQPFLDLINSYLKSKK